MYKPFMLSLLVSAVLGTEVELVVLSQEEALQELIVTSMKKNDLQVVDNVWAQNGYVIYWGTGHDGPNVIDHVAIRSYRKDANAEHPEWWHRQMPLISHFVLRWTRNDKINKEKQVALLSQITRQFCEGAWKIPQEVVVTCLNIGEQLNETLKQSFQPLRQDPSIVNAWLRVEASNPVDGNNILSYSVSRLTNDMTVALLPLDKAYFTPGLQADLGLLGRLEVTRYKLAKPFDAAQVATVTKMVIDAALVR